MFSRKDVNCIGYVHAQFGIKTPEQFVSPGPFNEVISPYFEIKTDLSESDAIAVAKKSGNRMVLHMGILQPSRSSWVIHRPAYNSDIVREPLAVALEPYQKGLIHGRYDLLALKFPDQVLPPQLTAPRSIWSLIPRSVRETIRDMLEDDEFSIF